jgi:peptidoglycan/LPS O-acetylase OafA/YrhL
MSTPLEPRTDPRNDWIDLLRGWAVLSVVLLHLQIRVPFSDFAGAAVLSKRAYGFLFKSGHQGVVVFFVISGFLITLLALERYGSLARFGLRDFYRRRFARLLPCLLLFIGAQSALQLAHVGGFISDSSPTSLPRTIVAALGFHLNWLEARDGYLPGAWDVLWSLSVEEAFYFCFPIGCLLLGAPWRIAMVLLSLVVIGPFARVAWTANEIWADKSYLSCSGEIGMGCLAALLAHRWAGRSAYSRRMVAGLLVCGAGLMIWVLYFRKQVFELGISPLGLDVTLLALGTALVLVAVHRHPFRAPRIEGLAPVRALRWLGRNSYEAYLGHMFVVLVAVAGYRAMGLGGPWVVGLYGITLVVTGLVAEAVARWYSRPMNQALRRRAAAR